MIMIPFLAMDARYDVTYFWLLVKFLMLKWLLQLQVRACYTVSKTSHLWLAIILTYTIRLR